MYGLYCSFAICKYWDPGYRRSSLEKYCYSCTARTFYRAWVAKELVYVFKHSGLCSQDLLLEQEDNGMELAWQKLTMVWLKQSKLDSLISYWSTGFWFEAIKMEMNMCRSKSSHWLVILKGRLLNVNLGIMCCWDASISCILDLISLTPWIGLRHHFNPFIKKWWDGDCI